jgi:hypothetical protein
MPEIPEPLVVGKIGHFMIFYGIPGWSPVRQFNMQIWPPGSQIGDHYMQGGKVANVDWDQSGDLYITSFRVALGNASYSPYYHPTRRRCLYRTELNRFAAWDSSLSPKPKCRFASVVMPTFC